MMNIKTKMVEVAGNLKSVRERIIAACAKRPPEYEYCEPRLVAVSKTKPPATVIEAYAAGQRHFGENYLSEMLEKACDKDILIKCKDIRWHYIGRLQKKKVNKILCTPNLYMVETVPDQKVARALNLSWSKSLEKISDKLKVMVQVNTSEEEEKGGCNIKEVSPLVKFIIEECEDLEFIGLMTIGMFGRDITKEANPDYLALRKCRDDVCKELNLDPKKVELSMGMSNDFEHAIELGSTNVRVGSAIFGERPKIVKT